METADQNREGTPLLKRAEVIRALGLEPHVEGGAYRRVYESGVRLPSGERSASAIYYLLGAEECSRLHRVGRDELWCWHGGRSLDLWFVGEEGVAVRRLGPDVKAGELPQILAPGTEIFGALPAPGPGEDHTLVTCVVTPEFTEEAYHLLNAAEAAELVERWDLPRDFLVPEEESR